MLVLTDEDVRHPELLGVDGVQGGVVTPAVLYQGADSGRIYTYTLANSSLIINRRVRVFY